MVLQRKQVVPMSDRYFKAIEEHWPNIRALYMTYESEKPIILYDIQEKKIFAYPYKEFKADLSAKSQGSLEHDYKSASVDGIIDAEKSRAERLLGSYYVNLGFKISCRGGPKMLGELLTDIFERIFVTGTDFAPTSVT
jgi:hypothetical protein